MFLALFVFPSLRVTALLCLFSDIWKPASYNLSCFIFKMKGWIQSLLYCHGTSLTFHLLMKFNFATLFFVLLTWINKFMNSSELNCLALLWYMVCLKLVKLVPNSLGKMIAFELMIKFPTMKSKFFIEILEDLKIISSEVCYLKHYYFWKSLFLSYWVISVLVINSFQWENIKLLAIHSCYCTVLKILR